MPKALKAEGLCEMGIGEHLLIDHCLTDIGTQMLPLPCGSCPFLCAECNAVGPAACQRDRGSLEGREITLQFANQQLSYSFSLQRDQSSINIMLPSM